MTRRLVCFCAALLLGLPAVAPGATEPADPSAASALKFERHGRADAARSIVLIPGMGCGQSVWDGTVEALGDRFAVYTVTLAGFDGVPPVRPPLGQAWARAIVELIEREKLRRPVVVGHSLGVSVAVRVATLAPQRVAALVAVDGTPTIPVPPDGQTAEQRKLEADAAAAAMRIVPAGAWPAVLRVIVRPMTKRGSDAERLVEMLLRSDRESIIESSREVTNDDLTPALHLLGSTPVTAIIAVPAPRPGETAEKQRDALETMYRRAFRGTRLTLRYVHDSGHMVMWDHPEAFYRELEAALDAADSAAGR
jgi:pimeloyl-ACP methyl ester carboxylesterase